jgi:hypothetical protein
MSLQSEGPWYEDVRLTIDGQTVAVLHKGEMVDHPRHSIKADLSKAMASVSQSTDRVITVAGNVDLALLYIVIFVFDHIKEWHQYKPYDAGR